MVKKITNNDLNEAKKGAAVVDFSAVWCGPCQMLAPVMEELSEELSGKAEFYNADSDENMGLAQPVVFSTLRLFQRERAQVQAFFR